MIDKQLFAEGMGRLAGTFRHDVDAPVIGFYYNLIAPHLTNDEWTRAVEITATTERFWPSPAVILEKIRPSAEGAFQTVVDALNAHGGYRFIPGEVYQRFDAPTKAALKAIGGMAKITNCEGDASWERLKKKFAAAFGEAVNPQPAIADTRQPDTKRLVARVSKDMALPNGDRD